MAKTVHVHLGPHKTGSTAIQAYLMDHGSDLQSDHDLTVIDPAIGKNLAYAMIEGDAGSIATSLDALSRAVAEAPGNCIVSCEDLSGNLPGRSQKNRIYPGIWQNVKRIRQTMSDTPCKFYFFVRDKDSWLRSAYAQHIQHRSRFSNFDDFCDHFQTSALWDGVLQRTRNRLQEDFVEIEYLSGSAFSSTQALLKKVLGVDVDVSSEPGQQRRNTSPTSDGIQILEKINVSGASEEAQIAAKRRLMDRAGTKSVPVEPDDLQFPSWPPHAPQPSWLSEGLAPLWNRASGRVSHQNQPNLLPDPFADLSEYRGRAVTGPDDFPEGSRARMENQVEILSYRFRGSSELCVLFALCVSYLRRDTEHTEHAAYLFQRLWAEEYEVLLGVLSTRWLISTFQTFMDHGANENQRVIGSAAYFMANTLKMYEAERALEGQKADATYAHTKPQTRPGFKGLDRFQLGGTDLMLNTNALLLELATRDDVAGRVVHEFMARLKKAHSVFTRMDKSRQLHGADVPQFANCWSFFEEPDWD